VKDFKIFKKLKAEGSLLPMYQKDFPVRLTLFLYCAGMELCRRRHMDGTVDERL
jgi:hypothetical protein